MFSTHRFAPMSTRIAPPPPSTPLPATLFAVNVQSRTRISAPSFTNTAPEYPGEYPHEYPGSTPRVREYQLQHHLRIL